MMIPVHSSAVSLRFLNKKNQAQTTWLFTDSVLKFKVFEIEFKIRGSENGTSV